MVERDMVQSRRVEIRISLSARAASREDGEAKSTSLKVRPGWERVGKLGLALRERTVTSMEAARSSSVR